MDLNNTTAVFLHIVPDDKFIDDAILFFEDLGGTHRWVSVCDGANTPFAFIKSDIVDPIRFSELERLVEEGLYDIVVFHSLYSYLYPVVIKVPADKLVIWNSWGADIYYGAGQCKPLVNLQLYKKLTYNCFFSVKRPSFFKTAKRMIKDVICPERVAERKELLRRSEYECKRFYEVRRQAIARVDVCSTVIASEYEELRQLPFFHANYYPFKYVAKKNKVDEQQLFCGDCILVGNSCDPSNNHLDVLQYLDDKGISNQRIVPLSYGNSKSLDVLKKKYGQDGRVILQTDFLNRPDYFELLRKCRAAVFGHIRQQALGNINQCLCQGSKVYLYKDSMVYKYYKSQGVVLFSIEDDLSQKSIEESLPIDSIKNNRSIIEENWDYLKVLERVRDFFAR